MTLLALRAGVRCIQYRRKVGANLRGDSHRDASRRELYEEALRLRMLTSDWGAALIVNDHADIALAVGADGVHLGQEDLPLKEAKKIMGDKIIGVSTHSIEEAILAEEAKADYIGYGPIFRTTTKDAGEPKGILALSEICRAVKIPVMAIGGITLESVPAVFSAGASAIAVASAILKADTSALKGDVEENAGEFMRKIHSL